MKDSHFKINSKVSLGLTRHWISF